MFYLINLIIMKNIRNLLITGIIILVSNAFVLAQTSENKLNLLLVREDKVIPSKVSTYEAALADLQVALTSVNEKGIQYFCHMQDDFCFTHVIPVNSLEDIQNLKINKLVERLGKPELNLIYDEMNSAIESAKYYMIQYCPDLSYVPEGENWIGQGQYRKWSFYYFYPGTQEEVRKILSAWKGLYVKNNVERGYRVFEGFLGTEQPLFILTNWAEDPKDHEEKLNKTMEQLGDESVVLWTATMEYVREVKVIEGWFLPQYSYTLGQKFAE
jgi:hypothetical protein